MADSSARSWNETLELEFELRRLGVDREALDGLATSGGVTHRESVRWMRQQPTGLGHEAFMARLHAADFGTPRGAEELPPDTSFVDSELEERRTFYAELERVAPLGGESPLAEGQARGLNIPHGMAHAVAVMRALPDAVGWRALASALRSAPPPQIRDRDPGV